MLVWLQGEVERRAFFDRSFCPNFPAVSVDDSLHRGQADAGTWKFSHEVEALESSEKPVGKTWIKPRTVVTNEISRSAIGLAEAEFNSSTVVA